MNHPDRRPAHRIQMLSPLLVVLGLLVAAPAPAPAAADEAAQRGRMVLVLDSSGSMAEPTGSGGTRIEAAREGLTQVVDALPTDAQVGMRVYGATVFEKSQPGACEDSQLVVPLGQGNREALKAAVAAYQPYGETPIGYALRQAAGDVGPSGPRTVVLVSDGEDTCAPPDPCQVAAELRAQGIDLRIDVVGLDVGGNAKAQLQCIAQAGGGEYYDAADAGAIAEALETVATKAVRPFELSGTPVDGTPQPTGAPVLEPGTYVDELPAREQPIHFAVTRTVPGSTLWASATLRNSAFVGTLVVTASVEGRDCRQGIGQVVGTFGIKDVLSASTATWTADPSDLCNTADQVTVAVYHVADELVGQPFELRVTEEPPVRAGGDLPPPVQTTQGTWTPMPGGQVGPVISGGTSLAAAVPLAPGVHALEVVPGETQVFSVTLDWGQRLQAVATVPARTGALAELSDEPLMTAQVFGPDRGTAQPYLASAGKPILQGGITDASPSVSSVETVPVTYLNRSLPYAGERATARAGTYLLVVGLNADRTGDTFVAPATLEVAVVGTPVDPPAYTQSGPDPTLAPTDAPSITPTATSTTEPADVAAEDEAGGLPGWLLPLGAVVVGLVIGAILLRRRAQGASGS